MVDFGLRTAWATASFADVKTSTRAWTSSDRAIRTWIIAMSGLALLALSGCASGTAMTFQRPYSEVKAAIQTFFARNKISNEQLSSQPPLPEQPAAQTFDVQPAAQTFGAQLSAQELSLQRNLADQPANQFSLERPFFDRLESQLRPLNLSPTVSSPIIKPRDNFTVLQDKDTETYFKVRIYNYFNSYGDAEHTEIRAISVSPLVTKVIVLSEAPLTMGASHFSQNKIEREAELLAQIAAILAH